MLLIGLTILLLAGLVTPPDPRGIPTEMPPDQSDSALFRAVAARMADGEAYYPAMGDELVARGYPTGSVANWRTPLYLELVAHAPRALRALLLLVAVLVLGGTALALRPVSTGALVAGVLLQNGVVAGLWVGQVQVMPELLTGGLIALSVLVFLRGWSRTSVLLGTAALFVRELAVPYAAMRLAWALWRREWREALGWALGFGVFGALSAVAHRAGQSRHASAPDLAHHVLDSVWWTALRARHCALEWLVGNPALVDHSVRAGGDVPRCVARARRRQSLGGVLSDRVRHCGPAVQLVLGVGARHVVALDLGTHRVEPEPPDGPPSMMHTSIARSLAH